MGKAIISALWTIAAMAMGTAHAEDCAPGAASLRFVFVGIDHYWVTDRPGHEKDLNRRDRAGNG